MTSHSYKRFSGIQIVFSCSNMCTHMWAQYLSLSSLCWSKIRISIIHCNKLQSHHSSYIQTVQKAASHMYLTICSIGGTVQPHCRVRNHFSPARLLKYTSKLHYIQLPIQPTTVNSNWHCNPLPSNVMSIEHTYHIAGMFGGGKVWRIW